MRRLKCGCGNIFLVVGQKRDIYDEQWNPLERCPGCGVDALTYKTRISILPSEHGGFKLVGRK